MKHIYIEDILNNAAISGRITKKVKDAVAELFSIYRKRLLNILGYIPEEFVFLENLKEYNRLDVMNTCKNYDFIKKNIDDFIKKNIDDGSERFL